MRGKSLECMKKANYYNPTFVREVLESDSNRSEFIMCFENEVKNQEISSSEHPWEDFAFEFESDRASFVSKITH